MSALRDVLTKSFDLNEMQSLAIDIGAAWEDLHGDTVTEKAIALIDWSRRHWRYDTLVQAVRKARPEAFKHA